MENKKQVDFERYQKFVDAVTSDQSTDFVALADRLVELDARMRSSQMTPTPPLHYSSVGYAASFDDLDDMDDME